MSGSLLPSGAGREKSQLHLGTDCAGSGVFGEKSCLAVPGLCLLGCISGTADSIFLTGTDKALQGQLGDRHLPELLEACLPVV